jgi:phage I-like protein
MPRPISSKSSSIAPLTAVAVCSLALCTDGSMQLLPAGEFRARDGRPADAPCWRMDAALAQKLIEAANARGTPYVTDYDHQTLLSRQNGQPAPAAGWFSKLEWREGEGLFATDVQWTDRARDMIAANEYRFISPVIGYDKEGNVTALYMAAVTNNPAIDGMDEVLLAAASAHFPQAVPLNQEIPNMDEMLEQLRWLLNLPVGATAQDILAQLNKLTDQVKQCCEQDGMAAASFDLSAYLTKLRTNVASLSAAAPDPAKFVSIDVVNTMQTQLASLTAELNTHNVDKSIKDAMAAGKLVPAMESWARDLGKKDYAALSSYLEKAPAIAALAGTQTGGNAPNATGGALTAEQIAMCSATGVSQEAFLKTLQAEAQA